MGEIGAACFHTLSDKEREIQKPDWDKERFGWICTSAENFAEWKKAIIKLCNDNKRCVKEVVDKVEEFNSKVDKNIEKVKKSRKG